LVRTTLGGLRSRLLGTQVLLISHSISVSIREGNSLHVDRALSTSVLSIEGPDDQGVSARREGLPVGQEREGVEAPFQGAPLGFQQLAVHPQLDAHHPRLVAGCGLDDDVLTNLDLLTIGGRAEKHHGPCFYRGNTEEVGQPPGYRRHAGQD
jgi:hypothetical protein